MTLRRTAAFIAWVTKGALVETACLGITASITSTSFCTTAVAIFAFFHNAIAALVATDGNNSFVVGQAPRVDRVPAQGTADVAHRAWRKVGDPRCRKGVHHELSVGVAGARGERTALARVDHVGVTTSRLVTVMNRTKGMTGFVSKDLPLSRRLGNDIGPGDAL